VADTDEDGGGGDITPIGNDEDEESDDMGNDKDEESDNKEDNGTIGEDDITTIGEDNITLIGEDNAISLEENRPIMKTWSITTREILMMLSMTKIKSS
jgi:hypothetical protein